MVNLIIPPKMTVLEEHHAHTVLTRSSVIYGIISKFENSKASCYCNI
jgi:hypothetical protein